MERGVLIDTPDCYLGISCRYAVSVRWESEQRERAQQIRSDGGPISGNEPPLTYTVEDFHKYCCCCARRVGSMFFLIEKPDGTPIVVAGPCWPFCTFVTVPLIVGIGTIVGIFIVSNPSTGLVSQVGYVVTHCRFRLIS